MRSTLSRSDTNVISSGSTVTRAGFDLRKVENVVDQSQQVRAGGVNIPAIFHLLGAQVASGVLHQLLSKNQDRVQRSTQFMRHVGQELRFVLRSEGEFRRLLLERSASLFDFLVLAFDFHVLFGQLLRL